VTFLWAHKQLTNIHNVEIESCSPGGTIVHRGNLFV
jgi:hypothetical protein